jgi:(4S)-4-hydroxy-5-phosphonooxypentane-2,3-dione isomerase
MYIVIVDFKLHPNHATEFMRAMCDNARASVEHEPGCRQFDVCAVPNDTTQVFLYEVYDNRAAFDTHLTAPHFLEFDRKVTPWVAHKAVRILERAYP